MDSTNMLKVRNFLCYLSLRAGTLLILWMELIFSFILLSIAIAIHIVEEKVIMILPSTLFIVGMIISAVTLLYFPAIQNRKYNRDSMNARCIKYLSWFNCMVTGTIMVSFAAWLIILAIHFPPLSHRTERIYWDNVIVFGIFSASMAGLFAHFAAVSFSFHQVITVGHDNLISNGEKNCMQMAPNGVQAYGIRLPMPPKPADDGSSCSTNFA